MAGQDSLYNENAKKLRFSEMFPSAEKKAAQEGASVIEMSMSPSSLALTLRNDITDQADIVRLTRYYNNWQFYLGQHWDAHSNKDDGIKRITKNYIKAFVNKLNRFLNTDGFMVVLPTEWDDLSRQLNKIWKINDHKSLSVNAGLNGCISGDWWIRINFKNEGSKKSISFSVIDSSLVFPFFDEFLELVKVEIRHPVPNSDGSISVNNFISEVHDKKAGRVSFYKTSYSMKDGKRTITAKTEMEKYSYEVPIPNTLLMFHCANYEVANAFWGLDDVFDLRDLNKEINEMSSSMSEIIKYMEQPITIVKGAKITNIEKSSRKTWSGIPKDGDVFNLTLNTDLPATQAALEDTKQTMHDLAGVPAQTLGKQLPISNTSGIALHYQNMPLMDVRSDKLKTYGKAYKDITVCVIKLLKWMGVIAKDVPNDLLEDQYLVPTLNSGDNPVQDMEIQFPNPLPRDEILLTNLIKAMFDLKLIGPDKAYRMLGISSPEIVRLRAEMQTNPPSTLTMDMAEKTLAVQQQAQQGSLGGTGSQEAQSIGGSKGAQIKKDKGTPTPHSGSEQAVA